MISKMTFAIAVSLAFLRLWATDGVLSSSQLDSGAKPYRYGNAIRWDGGVVAGDGGFATIRMNRSHDTLFYQDVKGLTLCGLDFANSMFTMMDNDITLTGERPVLTGGSYGGANTGRTTADDGNVIACDYFQFFCITNHRIESPSEFLLAFHALRCIRNEPFSV